MFVGDSRESEELDGAACAASAMLAAQDASSPAAERVVGTARGTDRSTNLSMGLPRGGSTSSAGRLMMRVIEERGGR